MSLESENNVALRLRKELTKLKLELAKVQNDIASLNKKKASAEKTLKKTKSTSTAKSKLNEIERYTQSLVSLSKKAGDIQSKIGKKEYDLVNVQNKFEKTKKREEEKIQKESQHKLNSVKQEVQSQKMNQVLLQQEIVKLTETPSEITVLFLASNPSDTNALRLDEEARAIQKKVRLSEYRDTLKFETRWAVRTSDLFQAINETNPTVIHFSGHGSSNGEFILQNPDGTAKFITPEAISQAIATVSDNVKLVFFNACHSESQAKNIVNYIDIAIGMSDSIRDDTACIFAAQFYSSIGFGLSIEQAFNQARAELILESVPGEDIPQLYSKDEINTSEFFLVEKSDIKH